MKTVWVGFWEGINLIHQKHKLKKKGYKMTPSKILEQAEKYKNNHKIIQIIGTKVKGGDLMDRTGFIWSIDTASTGPIVKFLDIQAGGMSSMRLANIKTIKHYSPKR